MTLYPCSRCGTKLDMDLKPEKCHICGLRLESNTVSAISTGTVQPQPSPPQPWIVGPEDRRLNTIQSPFSRATSPRSFNPLQKIRCPFCGTMFHPSDCAVFSLANNVVLEKAPEGLARLFARLWIKRLDGEKYTSEKPVRQCPRCKNSLPYFFEFSTNINVAIVGDTFSGKSHYIAALLDQLQRGGMMREGESYIYFNAQNPETEEMFKEYHTFLRDQSQLTPTQSVTETTQGELMVRKPLIYKLLIRNTIAERFSSNVNLIIYDISGEDIADSDRLQRLGWPILGAQAIIYLADPLSMINVRNALPTDLQPDKYSPIIANERTAHEIFDRMMPILQQFKKLAPGERVDIPIAIMLSKSDLLGKIIPPNDHTNFHLLQDVQYNGTLNEPDIAAINKEVYYLLERFGERGLTKQINLCSTLNFFATSATGCSADKQGRFVIIQPRRCLDPLLWILWKLQAGVVSSK